MRQQKLIVVNVFGRTAFNLEFYTEVQDLTHILPLLSQDPRMGKFSELNEKIVEVVEEFGLVSFETLAVEVCFIPFLLHRPPSRGVC